MVHMSTNAVSTRRDSGDSMQLTNCILESGATCNMTPAISYFIPGQLVKTDKYIKVADGNFITVKQTGELQIKMRYNNGKPFIATLHNVLLAPHLCDQLFSISKLMNFGHNCLFHKGFCTIFFSDNEKNAVALPHSAQRNMHFW